jgi:hypothetical protein
MLFKQILFVSIIFFITTSISAQVELKANIPTFAVGIPNVGVEFQVGKNSSLQLDVLGSFWDSIDGAPFQINQTFLEYRFYSKSNISGWFVGAHVGYGMFTFQKPYELIVHPVYSGQKDADNAFRSGRAVFQGISLGYKKALNRRLSLELFIGGGYAMSHYKGYRGLVRTDLNSEAYRPFNGSGEVLLYRGGLMFIYKIFPYKQKV